MMYLAGSRWDRPKQPPWIPGALEIPPPQGAQCDPGLPGQGHLKTAQAEGLILQLSGTKGHGQFS